MSGTKKGAGDGDALGLSFAEAATLFVEIGIEALREGKDKIGTGGAEGLEHIGFSGMRIAHEEIVADSAAEKGISLGDIDEVDACLRGDFESGKLRMKCYEPFLGVVRASNKRMRVVLPAPVSPRTAVQLPAGKLQEKWFSMGRSPGE